MSVQVSERAFWALLGTWIVLLVLNVAFERFNHGFWWSLTTEILGLVAAVGYIASKRCSRRRSGRGADD